MTLALAAAFTPAALRSSRPLAEPSGLGVHDAHEWLPTRLWQDPLLTVDRYRDALTAQYASIDDESDAWRIQLLRPPPPGGNAPPSAPETGTRRPLYTPPPHGVLPNDPADAVLVVTLAGGGYGDDIESRRRTRYAVLSALGALGFTPEDAEHIGVLGWQKQPNGFLYLCPFEIFEQNSPPAGLAVDPETPKRGQRVAVLWFNSDWLKDTPLQTLLKLRASLENIPDAGPRNNGRISSDAAFRVVGPRTSGQLEALAAEIAANDAFATQYEELSQAAGIKQRLVRDSDIKTTRASDLMIVSPWATRSLASRKKIESINNQRKADDRPPALVRVACDDGEMIDDLIAELGRRNISPDNGDRVLIVSEWDTLYGRKIKQKFTNAWGNRLVEVATYQRGLDGFVPGTGPDGGSAHAAADARSIGLSRQTARLDRVRVAPPEGPRQNDYIHRLADLLARESNDRFNARGLRRIKAVGVLGSDVHDKLLIMQALRQRFPDAVFMTTDLDAWFLHGDQVDTTRNLIVASGFDLRLHRQLQRSTPPFRDAYQTAIFLATQLAMADRLPAKDHRIEHGDRLADVQAAFLNRAVDPLLFEIGRNAAVPLNQPSKTDTATPMPTAPHHPAPRPGFAFSRWAAWFLVACVLCLLLVLRFHYGLRELLLYRRAWGKYAALTAAAAACLGWAWLVAYDSARPGGEPAAFAAGVSAWPTITIRFAACLLACAFLLRVRHRFINSCSRLCHLFDIDPDRHLRNDLEPAPDDHWLTRAKTWPGRYLRQWTADGWHDLTVLGDASERVRAQHGWRRVWDVAFGVTIGRGVRDKAFEVTVDGDQRLDIDAVAWRFLWLNRTLNRYIRIFSLMLVFLGFGTMLYRVWGRPIVPVRGELAGNLEAWSWWAAMVPFSILAAWMLDVVQTTAWFSRQLAQGRTNWSDDVVRRNVETHGIGADYVREWLDVKFIARLTELAGSFIMYPSVVFLLLLSARSTYFDRWPLTLPLAIVLGAYFAALVYAAWKTRQAAINARDRALHRVEELGRQDPNAVDVDASTGQLPAQSPLLRDNEKQADLARLDIGSIREGAYLWLMRGPAVVALLWAVGGYSVITLLEFFAVS
ncbi:MAG: hypothetical protein AAGK09_08080 [Planctomycetota bacterium]